MKQRILSITALLLLGMTAAYAGPMGEPKKPLSVLTPFLAGEFMYTWPQVEGGLNVSVPTVGTFGSSVDKTGWGGRVAAGALHAVTEKWTASAEMGWGYYGSFNIKPALKYVNGDRTRTGGATVDITAESAGNALRTYALQYGVDVLAGLYYTRPKYDLFFKAGALVQNLRTHVRLNPTGLFGASTDTNNTTNRFPGTYQLRLNIVNVLPAIRLGGGYHVKENWLITASWMHAFGRKLDASTLGITTSPSTTITNFSGHIYVPTIDTLLFGLEYRFA